MKQNSFPGMSQKYVYRGEIHYAQQANKSDRKVLQQYSARQPLQNEGSF